MTEGIVSLKTAKLLKEKGCNFKSRYWYDMSSLGGILIEDNSPYDNQAPSSYKNECAIYAPTQSLAQKWLRDVHKIHIEPHYETNTKNEIANWWFYLYPKVGEGRRVKYFPDEIKHPKTYEEALEEGLQAALENWIED